MVSPKSPAEVLAQIRYTIMFKNQKNHKLKPPTSRNSYVLMAELEFWNLLA